jgi:F0F1-type ATP synthase membrane subunit b/b'
MFLGTWFVPRADAEFKEEHRHIHHAIHELREAKVELQEAKHDFGGHREQALKAVEAALFQLKECLVGAKDPFDSVKVDKDIYKKHENHPHIHEAIHELKDARTQLKEAKHDFGGHREQAIKDIDYAIEQLEICLKHVK